MIEFKSGKRAFMEAAAPARTVWVVVILSVLCAAAAMIFGAWHAGRIAGGVGFTRGEGAALPLPPQTAKAKPPAVEPVDYVALRADEARLVNAAVPFSARPVVAASPFRFLGASADRERAVDCLAAAGFYEAGNDRIGQRSVMQVVLNRVRHPAFPASVCAVVFQGAERTTGCQFSFTCDKSMDRRRPTPAMWTAARGNAEAMIGGQVDATVGLSTHYHTDWVVPVWSATLDKTARIGTHLFFRWPGWWGTPAAFRAARGVIAEPAVPQLADLSSAHLTALPIDAAALASGEGLSLPGLQAVVGKAASGQRGASLIEAEDVRPDLRGNRVLRASADGTLYLVALNRAAFPGSYAMSALSLCRDKVECRVYGWLDPESAPTDRTAVEQASASFIYVRRRGGGGDTARWDCTRFDRAQVQHCI